MTLELWPISWKDNMKLGAAEQVNKTANHTTCHINTHRLVYRHLDIGLKVFFHD